MYNYDSAVKNRIQFPLGTDTSSKIKIDVMSPSSIQEKPIGHHYLSNINTSPSNFTNKNFTSLDNASHKLLQDD